MQILSHKPLSRRHLLRGIGATLALPSLEIMAPTRALAASGEGAPVRMACLFMPNGVRSDRWTPKGKNSSFELSPILSPLESLKNDILVLSNLEHKASKPGDGHYVKCSGWLTGTTITKTVGKDINANGISIDQLAAKAIGKETKLPSLELGTESPMSGVDTNVDYTKLYANHVAWKSPTSPLPCEINPRSAFDRLFRSKRAADSKSTGDDRSILDLVLEDAKRLHSTLGKDDQQKLDEYLDSVRSVEQRIDHEEKQLGSGDNLDPAVFSTMRQLDARITAKVAPPGEGGIGSAPRIDPSEHVRLMMDVMHLAFWSDSTRISTFMFGHAVSGRNFSFLEGVNGGHHEISHHKNDPNQLDQYQRINTWHTRQFAYLVEKMKSTPEGSSNLLDNSLLLFGSGLRDGNSHSPHNIPLVLAGSGRGQVNQGRHVEYDRGTPFSNLLLAIHNIVSPNKITKFADSSNSLRRLS